MVIIIVLLVPSTSIFIVASINSGDYLDRHRDIFGALRIILLPSSTCTFVFILLLDQLQYLRLVHLCLALHPLYLGRLTVNETILNVLVG